MVELSPEEVTELKNKLKQRKGVIGRYVSKLKRLVLEGATDELSVYIGKCKQAFDSFDDLYTHFVIECGDDDATYSEQWFDDVQNSYLEAFKSASEFLAKQIVKSDSAPDTSAKGKVTKLSSDDSDCAHSGHNVAHDLESLINLPRVEIDPYGGDPLQYHSFIRTFDITVERTCSDADARLTRLVASTKGAAREAIQGTLVLGGEAGYRRARAILAELFGADQIIVQEIVKGLTGMKCVKTAEQMRSFSHKLISARDILTKLNALQEVDAQIVLKSIVATLPEFAQSKWRKKQLESKRSKSSYLKFDDFVEFAKRVSADMSDPLCSSAGATSAPAAVKPPKEKAFAQTETSQGSKAKGDAKTEGRARKARADVPRCLMCNENHGLWRCSKFKV